jgi:signal transduction histidine kinase/HAMP domain-containing protein
MWLAPLPIKWKLVAVMLLTSGVVVLLTLAAFLTYEFFTHRKTAISELSGIGSIVATNSTAALAFDSPQDAEEILSALRAEPQIVLAVLYDKDGNVFSVYPEGATGEMPVLTGEEGYALKGGYLEGFQPVVQGDARLGTLFIRSNMTEAKQRFQLYFILAAVLAVGALVMAFIVSFRLQKRISRPILSLAKTAAQVSASRDYSLRASKENDDEIGSLTDAFNNMLSEIEAQNRELHARHVRLGNMVQGMADSYMCLDAQWRVTDANHRALERMRRTREQIIGKVLWEEFPGLVGSIFWEHYHRVMRERTPASFVAQAENYSVWIDARVLPQDDGIAVFFTDITKYKQAEEEVRSFNQKLEAMVAERTRELEAANKELESFSYSVSHDLRAPLRSIHGYMNIFSEEYGGKLDDEATRLITIIQHNARRMGQLIDDLLSFSRLGRKELMKGTISMEDMVDSIWEELKREQDGRDIEFTRASLPPAFADSVTMRHVWTNLLSNALKYTNRKPKAIIEVGGSLEEDRILYFVRDNGSGFDMRYYEKLFGVFQRLHSQEEFEGTGVGLAMVQRIVHRHGGTIWADARPDAGATFYFALPRH